MAHPKQVVTIEEAAGIIHEWKDLNTSGDDSARPGGIDGPPSPYAGVHERLADFYTLHPPTVATPKPESSSTEEPPRRLGSPELTGHKYEPGSMEDIALTKFEQETWNLYELEGTLDSTRLLEECQSRALDGDSHAKARLDILHDFHRIRHEHRSRWAKAPRRRRLPEVAPDPLVRAALGPHMWALLIGNNGYPQSPLLGAVNDTTAWKAYLLNFIGVPESHITHIQDADRQTMITALYNLRDNAEITEGDHIIFAFSGHGSSYDAKFWSFEEDVDLRAGSIEALCPVDRGLPQGAGAPDVSDRELLLILSEIRDQTKANITVVLDCCHSGGGARELSADWRSRALPPLVDDRVIKRMFTEADEHPRRRPSTMSVRSPGWAKDTAGVYRPALLAACQDTELAWETSRNGSSHGLFTHAAMQVLRSEKGVNLTCSGLIDAIGYLRRDQKPRLDGQNTVLFAIRKPILDGAPSDSKTCL